MCREPSTHRLGATWIATRRRLLRRLGGAVAALIGASGLGAAGARSAPNGTDRRARVRRQGEIDIEYEYQQHQLRITDVDGILLIFYDGVPIDAPMLMHNEEVHSHYFPFSAFPSLESLAEQLVDSEGYAWAFTGQGLDVDAIRNA